MRADIDVPLRKFKLTSLKGNLVETLFERNATTPGHLGR